MVFDPSKLLASIDVPADWVGLRIVKAQSTHRSVRDGHPEGNQRSHQQGAMVEVLVDGQIGYGASNALTPASLQAAAPIPRLPPVTSTTLLTFVRPP